MKKIVSYMVLATGIIACPCHLIFTLPLAASLLGGTALGAILSAHMDLIIAAAAIYFFILVVGLFLWPMGRYRSIPGSASLAGREKKRAARKNKTGSKF